MRVIDSSEGVFISAGSTGLSPASNVSEAGSAEVSGKMGSVSSGPGIIMGVGNTGDYLRPYLDGDLWISDDAGLTWSRTLESAHKYEFGDQGTILTAVYDEGPTNEIKYSLDHGKTWETKAFTEDKVRSIVDGQPVNRFPSYTKRVPGRLADWQGWGRTLETL